MKLTVKQWEKVEGLVPDGVVRRDGKGRPWRDKRAVLEGILWIVKTGVPWKDLPKEYLPYQTYHRKFRAWIETSVFDQVIEALARDL